MNELLLGVLVQMLPIIREGTGEVKSQILGQLKIKLNVIKSRCIYTQFLNINYYFSRSENNISFILVLPTSLYVASILNSQQRN